MPRLPLGDLDTLRGLADGFNEFHSLLSPLYGRIGSLYGISIAVKNLSDQYSPRNFYYRKGKYVLPIQALVDYRYCLLYMSCRCVDSTHESLAFYTSYFAQRLRDGALNSGWWIAGDAEYMCSDEITTQWNLSALHDPEEGIYRDCYNFYRSSARIEVKQAFGILVSRWGIISRPLRNKLVNYLPIISFLMRLHSFAIDQGEKNSISPIRTLKESQKAS